MTQHKTTSRSYLSIRHMVFAALFLALTLVLPFLTGQIPQIGSMLCPMHIPVLLCGFLCGWPWGLIVGVIAPPLRSILFGMPPMFPTATAMAFELATYGLVSGLMYQKLPKKNSFIYAALLVAMLAGRIVWGIVQFVIAGLQNSTFTMSAFLAGAVTSALPGIILQLVLIPLLVIALKRAKVFSLE